jgi:hypothetical protein
VPEPPSGLPDFNATVTIGQVLTALFELGLHDLDDCADRDFARLLAEHLEAAAPERQLTLALAA